MMIDVETSRLSKVTKRFKELLHLVSKRWFKAVIITSPLQARTTLLQVQEDSFLRNQPHQLAIAENRESEEMCEA